MSRRRRAGAVGPVDDVLEEALIVLDPLLHQLHRLLAEIDARPLPFQAVSGDHGGRASAERVEHEIPLAGRGRDDPLGQGDGLLGWIVEVLLRVGPGSE